MNPTRRQTLVMAAAGAAAVGLPLRAFAQAAATTGGAPAFLTPIEHATLMLTLNGQSILVDPVGGADRYADMAKPAAILITHEHQDHFDPDTLQGLLDDATTLIVNPAVADKLPAEMKDRATVMANGDTGEVAGMKIEAVPAYNITPERQQYHPQGRDNGYVLTSPDHGRIYIAGDTEDTPEFRAQTDIDTVLLPMNLPYTMDAEHAAAGVIAMKPRRAIPYHHRGIDPADFQATLQHAGSETEVIVLDWYPQADNPTGEDS
ncbi:MBL fold metallo-hydrolase [uncultured Paracoccus sp.]|uniref:MBL fold metallo-hydrolase n=1 Tax=uncultured Paracoccus sp. TaxID=189685 RepID=UPI002606E391|nr:MBL fold metallo-hydrolase [uncultured Paracoccus sp.]